MKLFLTLLLSLATACAAAQVRLAWNAAPPAENVGQWRVYRMEGAARTLLATVTSPAATIQADPGQVIGVTAFNGLESQPVTLTIPATVTDRRYIEIQVSTDLREWKTIALVPLIDPKEPSRFIRAKLPEISKP